MNREQTHPLRLRGTAVAWWLPLFLLVLAAAGQAPVGSLAAQAEAADKQTEGAEQQTEEAADKADSETDSKGEGNEEAKNKEDTKKDPKKTDDKPQEKEAPSDGDSKATVETERPEEVDPLEGNAKKDEKKSDLPKTPKKKKRIIGATATLLEKQSGLKFRARVDSGAKTCSLHVEKIRIKDESTKEDLAKKMAENIGKVIHFEVKNGDDKTHILTSKIAGYVIIKNSNKKKGKRRYKVPLTFLWKNMEKEVLVTLNDRKHMEYPLLLGRNFLRGDFLIDVELNSDDK